MNEICFDMGYMEKPYTWINKREEMNVVKERLDRSVCTPDFYNLFPLSSVKHLDFTTSYHSPLKINVRKNGSLRRRQRERRFKFEVWLQYDEFADIVKEGWRPNMNTRENLLEDFQHFVVNCLKRMENWGRAKKGNYEEKIRRAKTEYQRAIDTNKGIVAASIKLEKVMIGEEIYWKQRARVDWMKWGDKNTAWFHRKATQRRKKNSIEGLFDKNGV